MTCLNLENLSIDFEFVFCVFNIDKMIKKWCPFPLFNDECEILQFYIALRSHQNWSV